MHEYDNVKDCLKDLLVFNDTRNKDFRVKDEDGTEHEATVKDLQELNTEALYNLADLLGMSDLYLYEGIKKADATKASAKKVAEITKKEIEKVLKKMGAEFGSDTTIY